jgi:hypothetical protein
MDSNQSDRILVHRGHAYSTLNSDAMIRIVSKNFAAWCHEGGSGSGTQSSMNLDRWCRITSVGNF